jgi:hypothetical protein
MSTSVSMASSSSLLTDDPSAKSQSLFVCACLDWPSIPMMSSLLDWLKAVRVFGLKASSSSQQRGRFVESVLIAVGMFSFVVYAAMTSRGA